MLHPSIRVLYWTRRQATASRHGHSSRDKARQSNEQYAEPPGALTSGMSFLGGE